MERELYDSAAWRGLREQARKRDGHRCSVSRLLGGECSGLLHVHHLDVDGDPLDIDNLLTVCNRCHPRLEALRRAVLAARPQPYRCPHRHRSAEARRQCEERHRRLALSA